MGATVEQSHSEQQSRELAELKARADELTIKAAATSGRAEAITQQEADDRSMITRHVMQQFGIAALAVFGLLALSGYLGKDWSKPAEQAVDMLKSVILPIVTLVLVYYFGRSSK